MLTAQLTIAFDQRYIDEKTCQSLVDQYRRVSGMLSNLITYLKDSRYRGTKYEKPATKSMAEEVNEILQKIRSEKDDK